MAELIKTEAENIPFLFVGDDKAMATMIAGGIPQPGDKLDLVVYESSVKDGMNYVKARWEIRRG